MNAAVHASSRNSANQSPVVSRPCRARNFLVRRFLAEHGCRKVHEVHGNAWKFPPLAEMRAAWEKAYGGAWQWQEEINEWRAR